MIREMFLYPWDMWDEGQEKVADELQQMDVRRVSVAALYHQARLLLPHNSKEKLKMHAGGSLYVPFRAEDYSLLAPRRGADIPPGGWENMVSGLKKRGISVSAWTVLLHNSFLASAFPNCAVVNVYGDHLPNNLCPSAPEVKIYLEQLIKDITAAGVDQIDAESLDYGGFLHGDHHEMQAYQDTASLNRLLGLCFCPHCMERARRLGIDGEGLKKQVRRAADAFLEMRPLPAVDASELQAYDDMRCGRIAELYRSIQGTGIAVRPILWAADGAEPAMVGVDPKRMRVEQIIACYPGSPDQVVTFVERIRKMTDQDTVITGGIRLMAPHTLYAAQGLDYERAYQDAGICRVIYYQYGMAPQPYLDALKVGGKAI